VKLIFADTIYWVALINPKDQWRGPALSAQTSFHNVRLVTTDVILLEVLNFFAEHGEEARFRAVSTTEEILTNSDTEVVRAILTRAFLQDWHFTKLAPTRAIVLPTASR
jgi:hypothetical protein